jgi:cell division septum initiation protein DivIVA
MELSPESVSSTTFKIVKKGCDPDEVKSYLAQLASSFEAMQKHAAAMEARARAATARLQEIAAQPPSAGSGAAQDEAAESISRALLLAQRTADSTIRDATLEASQITMKAKVEAQVLIDGAQGMLNRLLDDAKADARRSAESERVQIQNEVESLLARRDFLLSDVENLEQHIVSQRERLRDVASALSDIVSKVPGGLADLRRPVISASGDDLPEHDSDSAIVDDTHTEFDNAEDAVDETPLGGVRAASELAPPVIDANADIDTTPPWGVAPADPAALGTGDDTPVPMVPQHHSDALVAVPQAGAVVEGYYDVTKPMPRVRFTSGPFGDQPG